MRRMVRWLMLCSVTFVVLGCAEEPAPPAPADPVATTTDELTEAAAGPSSLVAVYADDYYRSLSGEAARAVIEAHAPSVSPELLEAVAASSGDATGDGPQVGQQALFYADHLQWFTLRAIRDNAEVWVANDMSYGLAPHCPDGYVDPRQPDVVPPEMAEYLADQLNDVIYPSNAVNFGEINDRDGTNGVFQQWGPPWDSPWYLTDNPQRIMALVYNIVDEGYCDPTYPFYVAGYFWPTMNDYYGDRNIIHIDSLDWANRVGADAAIPHLYEQVFTHELEHAIHYDHDADEPSWVDEGMADLAPFLAGYGHSTGHLAYYMVYHRTPLTFWGGGLEDYGASYLFQLYLLQNFGPAFIRGLVDQQENGIPGIEAELAAAGENATFDDIYRDWTLANYLDDPTTQGRVGRLGYDLLDVGSADTQGYTIQWSIDNYYGSDNAGNLPLDRYWGGYKSRTVQYPIGEVAAYAPMYLTYQGFQPELISDFYGDDITGVAAHDGAYQLWSGKGDLLYSYAVRVVPISVVDGTTISFWANYEIEEQWDFAFAQITTDFGDTWESLENENTRWDAVDEAHPDVLANLPGFTGSSSGWSYQSFDLSDYAGETVFFSFLYVTDWAYNEAGFYVDDFAIDGVVVDDFEGGSGAWAMGGGFEHTTGLVTNDWELTFLNPTYEVGRLAGIGIVDDSIDVVGPYQMDHTALDTLQLNNDEVTIVVSNHLPEASSFPAAYVHFVKKGNAR